MSSVSEHGTETVVTSLPWKESILESNRCQIPGSKDPLEETPFCRLRVWDRSMSLISRGLHPHLRLHMRNHLLHSAQLSFFLLQDPVLVYHLFLHRLASALQSL